MEARADGKQTDRSIGTSRPMCRPMRLSRKPMATVDRATTDFHAFAKVKAYLEAVAKALRGQAFESAALTMDRTAHG